MQVELTILQCNSDIQKMLRFFSHKVHRLEKVALSNSKSIMIQMRMNVYFLLPLPNANYNNAHLSQIPKDNKLLRIWKELR